MKQKTKEQALEEIRSDLGLDYEAYIEMLTSDKINHPQPSKCKKQLNLQETSD